MNVWKTRGWLNVLKLHASPILHLQRSAQQLFDRAPPIAPRYVVSVLLIEIQPISAVLVTDTIGPGHQFAPGIQ